MKSTPTVIEPDLRISAAPVLIGIVAAGLGSLLIRDFHPDRALTVPALSAAVVILALAAAAGILADWRPQFARPIVALAAALIIWLVAFPLAFSGATALLALPTLLAAVLVSIPAALVATAITTALVLITGGDGLSLLAVWAAFGLIVGAYHRVSEVAGWATDRYHEAHAALEEARDRKVTLEQALADLAQANQQLTRLNELAQGLRQVAEDARTAKAQFVANVSHELRTPLNMITGFSEMILEAPEVYGGGIPTALMTDLGVIHRNAQHLSELIDDVLDLSQVEADQMALTREPTPFGEIIDSAVEAVRPLFASKRLYLKTELPDDMPVVWCDRTRIREVLLNLISNAGRFTETGGVTLRVQCDAAAIEVSVADTGAGIAPDALDRLFQPFHQADNSIRRRYGGTGLGLSISKRFIELHDGKIWVASTIGAGTTFTFRLPLAPPIAFEAGYARGLAKDWEYVQRTRPSAAPKTIPPPRFVVLEQGDALQRLLRRYLGAVELVQAGDLETALREVADQPSRALLVNDLSLTGALARVQAATLPPDTPALICSVPGVQDSAGAFGAADYLVKPIARATILAALDRLQITAGTILIVDDEPEALRLFRRILSSSGRDYRVLRAADGHQALTLLRAEHPDVMLMDLVMPNMDGFQLLEVLRDDPKLCDIPVIITSARDPAGQPIVSRGLAVNMQDGLSAQRLLACIMAITDALAPTARG